MESLSAYIPIDRWQAMAQGKALPDRAQGTALFADISGFTPLTEALVIALGPQRGAEELPQHLNRVYNALTAEIHRYRGSVLSFAGDAITCWFESDPALDSAALRATTCALALQKAMGQFANLTIPGAGSVSLTIKVAVAAGLARRFLVGDPGVQIIDALAGGTLSRLAAAEHQANSGDVILDQSAVDDLGDGVIIAGWRRDEDQGERFAVVQGLAASCAPAPWPALDPAAVSEAQTRSWLLPPVYERLKSGLGEFLTELRPAAALFLSFGGIDFDNDELAGHKLNTFVVWAQQKLNEYGGSMLQLTFGDKGNYLYAAFGAPVAHEDDAVRAVSAALAMRSPGLDFISQVRIGISQGRLRTGAYGANSRRTYGALGDEVNLAARLMQHAAPGQVWVSEVTRKAAGDSFTWETLPPLRVKGKSRPIIVFRLIEAQKQRAVRLQEPQYALPMVGRAEELSLVAQKMDQALRGHGQIIGVTAEAGMGKSRLVAEIIRRANEKQFIGYGGECLSYGTNTSYLVWHSIWRSFFGVDPAWAPAKQINVLKRNLRLIDPALEGRLPLLGAALNLPLPDNDFTQSFDPKLRKSSLESLLVDCLRGRAKFGPLMLVLEDCHWIDPLSQDLLTAIGRAIVDAPVLIVLAYRPPQLQSVALPVTRSNAHFTELQLTYLPAQEVDRFIRIKLNRLYDSQLDVPPALLAEINDRSQGNPFFIEEMLNYLYDQGFDPQKSQLQQLALPASLHSLILSRIDQLSENQKTLLKVASVIGRLFKAAMLWGVYDFIGGQERVRAELDLLSELELTPLDTPDPELTYLFKHVITQEVTYESLPYATRAFFHEQIGQYMERTYPEALEQYIALLAYHYDRSQNEAKRREYLLRAGEQAQANYANRAAISFYQRLLPLLAGGQLIDVLLKLGQALELDGQWPAADEQYQQALNLAEQAGDLRWQGLAQTAIAELLRKESKYPEAASWYDRARTQFEQIRDQGGIAKILTCLGTLAAQQGKYDEAQRSYEQALVIRRRLDHQPDIGNILNNMSLVAQLRGDLPLARSFQEESLAIRRALENKWAVANSLGNLGYIALDQNALPEARARLEEAVAIQREIGDKWALANALNNLGNVVRNQGKYSASSKLYEESLLLNRELGDRWALAYVIEDTGGMIALRGGQPERALRLAGGAATIREAIGAPLSPVEQTKLDNLLDPARQALGASAATAAWESGRSLTLDQVIELALEPQA
jgi:class 3 adenylate cyclase/tetratricopeptide (TPR) repeat protein